MITQHCVLTISVASHKVLGSIQSLASEIFYPIIHSAAEPSQEEGDRADHITNLFALG